MVFRKSLEDVELNGMQIFIAYKSNYVYFLCDGTYHLTIK